MQARGFLRAAAPSTPTTCSPSLGEYATNLTMIAQSVVAVLTDRHTSSTSLQADGIAPKKEGPRGDLELLLSRLRPQPEVRRRATYHTREP
jgi:hypothetical protein